MTHKKPRTYIPADLEIKWENLEPLYKDLCDRPINSVEELEHWLHDRSELEAALEEDFAWRYNRMTSITMIIFLIPQNLKRHLILSRPAMRKG